jgi:DnaK suppressor protein
MTSSDSPFDTGKFLKRLHEEREDLKVASDSTASARRPVKLDQQSVGRLSRMDALQNQAMARSTEQRRIARLVAIEAAIARLNSGEFGHCSDCGDRIAERRLDLDPTISRCISCAA